MSWRSRPKLSRRARGAVQAMGKRNGWHCQHLGRLERTRVMRQSTMQFTPR
jgi:hypothetical protein